MAPSRRKPSQRGASIVELAFIAPVLVLVVMAVLDLALAYRLQIRLENAAREGAAYAQLHPNDVECPGTDIVHRVTSEDDGIASLRGFRVVVLREGLAGSVTVPVQGCGGTAVGRSQRVRVEAWAEHRVMTPLVSRAIGSTVRISGSVEVEAQA